MLKRAMDNPKITFLKNTTVLSWRGSGQGSVLTGALLSTNGEEEFEVK